MAKCKHETPNGRCGLKESYAYRHKCYTEECCKCHEDIEPCGRHEPITNADRIRAMSDEELAKNLYRFCDLEERVGYCKNLSECEKLLDTEDGIPEQKCICCLLEWLKQPAEVE